MTNNRRAGIWQCIDATTSRRFRLYYTYYQSIIVCQRVRIPRAFICESRPNILLTSVETTPWNWMDLAHRYTPKAIFIKMAMLYGYRNANHKPQMVWWLSQVYNWNIYTNKSVFSVNKSPDSLFIDGWDTDIIRMFPFYNPWWTWHLWYKLKNEILEWT